MTPELKKDLLFAALGFRGYPDLECGAYVPADALIILVDMFRMLGDIPGSSCWPAVDQRDDQDGRAAGDAGRAAVWGWLSSA